MRTNEVQSLHLVGGFFLTSLVIATAYMALAPHPAVITLTEDGFKPDKIQIRQGGSVKFVTTTGRQFWPASDSHPTHQRYPMFDPERALNPDESWEFTFDTPGVWSFHDHLDSRFHGRVIVLGERKKSAVDCSRDATGTARAACWEGEFATIVEQSGIDKAFEALAVLHSEDPVFREVCHDVTHYIGEIAYNAYQKDSETIVRPETSYCAYGFYHGFIETAIANEGSAAYEAARNYCKELRSNPSLSSDQAKYLAQYACQHGVGHAAFDSIPSKYWGDAMNMAQQGVQICEDVFPEGRPLANCVSGVFNSLAIALNAKYYDIEHNESDPTYVCKQQKEIHKPLCFKEVVMHYNPYKELPLEQFVLALEPLRTLGAVGPSVMAYIDNLVRNSARTPKAEELHAMCSSLSNKDDVFACIEGALIGIRGAYLSEEEQSGKQGEFCSLFTTTLYKEKCSNRDKFL